jgi:O-antigen biosynthesis protein
MKHYRDIIETEAHHAINKWSHYPEIYDEVFAPYRDQCRSVLEIGVQHGGSLQALARLFPGASVYGLDVNPACAALNGRLGDRIRVVIGDATNLKTLASLPAFDVIIDDGAHVPQMQAVAFSFLFQHKLSADGVYVIEDMEHSYYDWWRKEPWFALNNFFDFVRARIDEMHLAYTNSDKARASGFALRIRKIVTYHGIVAFYKSEGVKLPQNLWWEGPRIL